MKNRQEVFKHTLKNFILRVKSVDGKFIIDESRIVHESIRDINKKRADVLVALFLYEYKHEKNPIIKKVSNGMSDLHHLSYMLNLPYTFCWDVLKAGRSTKKALTHGTEHNYEELEGIRQRVKIREALETLV